MAFAETTSIEDPEARALDVKLWRDDAELFDELVARTGLTASELVAHALGALWREIEGVVLPPPGPQEDTAKVLAESEADIAAGRTFSNEEVFGRIAAKQGW